MLFDISTEEALDKAGLTNIDPNQLLTRLLDHAIDFGLKLIIVAIVFVIGRWMIGWLRKFIDRFLERKKIENTVKSFLDSLINISLQVILFLVIINILGMPMVSFAAIIGAAGLAIGMAMKDNLSNFAGGVMLLINKPFRVGDRILAQAMDGTIKSMGILYTVLSTGDNRTIYIPNGPLSTGNIINFSDQKERRIDITLNLAFGNDINELKGILQNIIENEPLIKKNPAPFIGLTTLNNGTIDLTIRVWVNSTDYGSVNVGLNEKIYTDFQENNIYTQSLVSIKMIKD